MANFITRKTKIFMKNKNQMKRVFSGAALFLLCMVQGGVALATGMSGTYTINPSGSGSKNFFSFTAAFDSLHNNGISGPVVVNVANGIYNETLRVDSIQGVSATNTVTFQSASGDSSKVIIQDTITLNWSTYDYSLVDAFKSHWLTLKGMTFKVLQESSTLSAVFQLQGTHISIEHCQIIGLQSTDYMIYANGHYMNFSDNLLRYGIDVLVLGNSGNTADSNFTITNNIIDSTSGSSLYTQNLRNFDFIGNAMINSIGGNQLSTLEFYGGKIEKNKFNSGLAVIVQFSHPAYVSHDVVDNNFFSSDNTTALSMSLDSNTTLELYDNNLSVYSADTSSYALYISGYDGSNSVNVYDNNIANFSKGTAVRIDTSLVNKMDYNDIYTQGKEWGICSYSYFSKIVSNFTDWQKISKRDSHSLSVNPMYVNDSTDLHATNTSLQGKGIALSSITSDIDGNMRPNPPTIGANEISAKKSTCLSGSYTIGGVGADYPSFTAAVAALDSYGVCGPVVFNVANGTYIEQLVFDSVKGVSATNNITFQSANGDSSKVIIADSAANNGYTDDFAVVQFDVYSHWITMKGITIKTLPANYPVSPNLNIPLLLGYGPYGPTNITITHCQVIGLKNNSDYLIQSSGDNCTFTNNLIKNGIDGFVFGSGTYTVANTTASNNIIDSFSGSPLYTQNLVNLNFTGNVMTNNLDLGLGSLSTVEVYGCKIESNKFCSGIELYSSFYHPANLVTNLIDNNFIYSNNTFGFYIELDSSITTDFYFNNISLFDNNSGSTAFEATGYGKMNLTDNNISNLSMGTAINTSPSNVATMNYNNYYTTGTTLGTWNGSNEATLADWQSASGFDNHSYSTDPKYINDSTNINSTNSALSGAGIAISGITMDINGNIRSNPPTIGANEITPSTSGTVKARFYSNDTICTYSIISFTDSSKSNSCGTINGWLWSFGDGDTSSAQNPTHTYNTAGVFTVKLKVSSSGSCSDSFTKNIFVDSTCVWPGDANNNKLVEITDVLNIGIAYNDNGPSRGVSNNIWIGQHCDNWGKNFITGADYKHADCNGDGVVDSSDLVAVSINWGDTHKKTGNISAGNPSDPPFNVMFIKDSFRAGDTARANLILGTAAKPLKNAYGFAAAYSYDKRYIDSSVMVTFTLSWLGAPGKNLISFVKNDTANGILYFAATRTDHINISGYGNVGTLSIVLPDNLSGKKAIYENVKITPVLLKLISYDETNIPLYIPEDSFIAYEGATGLQPVYNNNKYSIKLYPSPASDAIHIDAGNMQIESITITDITGKEMYRSTANTHQATIDISLFSQGIYILSAQLKDGDFIGKFIKSN